MYRNKEELSKEARRALWIASGGGLAFIAGLGLQHVTPYELLSWAGGLVFIISILFWGTTLWED